MAERLNGANILMMALVDNHADTIFGYPGGAIMPVYDALHDYSKTIRHILVRHEQGAAHAAEGYARITGKPGVVLVTSGPGATNTLTGIADALMDSTPMVVISGQVARRFIGTQAFQEAPVVDMSRPVTKWSHQIQKAAEIPEVIDNAFLVAASGRPGPVLIDIPKDVQTEETDFHIINRVKPTNEIPLTSNTLSQLQQAAKLLNEAKKPYILAGHGVLIANAEQELLGLAEKAGIPVANTLLGLSSFPAVHPLFAGMLGMHGRYGSNVLTNQADVILAVGMRFDDRVTGKVSEYAKQAKIIHIDIDPTQLNRIIRAETAIPADAKKALQVLFEKVGVNQHPEWLNRFRQLDAIEDDRVTRKVLAANTPDLTMAEVMDLLSRKTSGEAVIVADVGQHQMVAAQRYRTTKSNSFITSGGMGTMGYALPAALGAKIGAPEREVIAVIGDGGFQMTEQELGTIAQEGTDVKIIVLDNDHLGMVRQWQDRFFRGRRSFVEMQNPDFVKLAKARNIEGETVTKREDLSAGLDRMRSSNKPYLLHIKVAREENVFPMMPPGAAVDQMILE